MTRGLGACPPAVRAVHPQGRSEVPTLRRDASVVLARDACEGTSHLSLAELFPGLFSWSPQGPTRHQGRAHEVVQDVPPPAGRFPTPFLEKACDWGKVWVCGSLVP